MSKEIVKSNTGNKKTSVTGIGKLAIGKIQLPRLFYQLVIFILDGSGSMKGNGSTGATKGQEISESIKEVIERLKKSKNDNSFDVSLRAYANEDRSMINQSLVSEIDLSQSFNPCEYIVDNRQTMIVQSLTEAKKEADDYMDKWKEKSRVKALFIVMSDGLIQDHEEANVVCNEIKSNPKYFISTVLYKTPGWETGRAQSFTDHVEGVLKEFASEDSLYSSSFTPEDIRKHMERSITDVSKGV